MSTTADETKYIKIVSKTTRELENYKTIDRIDPLFQYHIGNPQIVTETEAEIHLQFPKTGQSLDKLSNYATLSYSKFLHGFSNIFKAITEMNKVGFYHLDIKSSNITMDPMYRFKLIDFGLSGAIRRDTVFLTPYVFWPFETRLLARYQEDLCTVMSHEIFGSYIANSYIRTFIAQTEKDTSIIKDNYQKLRKLKEAECMAIIYAKIDVYSLGVTLHDMLQVLDVPRDLRDRLRRLCLRMTDFDIFKRLTCSEALEQYKAILS